MSRRTVSRLIALLALVVATRTLATAAPRDRDRDRDRVDVSIRNLRFDPDPVTVKVGQTLRWTNNDDRDYSLRARDNSWSSGNLRPRETFDQTFADAGEVEYVDALHPRLRGKVIVQER